MVNKLFGIFVCLMMLFSGNTSAQIFMSETSYVRFFSSAPLENIEAINKQAKAAADFDKKTFSVRIPVKSFVFEKDLMQEHFNENYMESEKFPNAVFKGVLKGDINLAKDGVYQLTASGEADIHGVKKNYEIPVKMTVKNGEVETESVFKVKLADHKIEIPTMVFKKIAEEVEVTVKMKMLQNKK